jgi:hypothetical protein
VSQSSVAQVFDYQYRISVNEYPAAELKNSNDMFVYRNSLMIVIARYEAIS